MDSYKELNKELVQQVQEMRVQLQAYREEVLSLHNGLLKKCEENANLKSNFNNVVRMIYKSLKVFDPEQNINGILNGAMSQNNEMEQTPIANTAELENYTERSASDQRRRSVAERIEDIRRSSALLSQPRPTMSRSPIRRSIEGTGFREQLDNENDVQDNDLEIEEVSVTYQENSRVIYEEDEEPEEEENVNETESENGEDGIYQLDETADNNNTNENNKTNENINNNNNENNNNNKNNNNENNNNSNKNNNETNNITENDTRNHSICSNTLNSSASHYTILTRSRDKSISRSTLGDITNTLMETVSQIQPTRNANTKQNKSDRSLNFPRNNASLLSIAVSELTISQFHDAAASSTPRANKSNLSASNESDSASSSLPSRRPSRSCKPKNLKERNMKEKYRNDTNQKSLGVCGKRAKSK